MQWKNTVKAAVITGIISAGVLSVAQAQPGGFWFAGALLDEEDDQVVVIVVSDDLPADDAGLEVDDVITEVEGEDVDSIADLVDILSDVESGEEIDLSIERDGDDETVTLDALPDVYWNAPTDTGSAAPVLPNAGNFPPPHNGNPPQGGFGQGGGNPPPGGFGQGGGNPPQGVPQDGFTPDNGNPPQGGFGQGGGNLPQGGFGQGGGNPPQGVPQDGTVPDNGNLPPGGFGQGGNPPQGGFGQSNGNPPPNGSVADGI